LDRTLTPCVVTRDLTRRLEKLLTEIERHLMGDEPYGANRRFQLSAMDELGCETSSSAEDIPKSGFR
jgi:hypothetical protein